MGSEIQFIGNRTKNYDTEPKSGTYIACIPGLYLAVNEVIYFDEMPSLFFEKIIVSSDDEIGLLCALLENGTILDDDSWEFPPTPC